MLTLLIVGYLIFGFILDVIFRPAQLLDGSFVFSPDVIERKYIYLNLTPLVMFFWPVLIIWIVLVGAAKGLTLFSMFLSDKILAD